MVDVKEIKWSETLKRVDFEVNVSRIFNTSYEFKAHIVGFSSLKKEELEEMAEKMVKMIDNENYHISEKRGTHIFDLKASFNANGFIYKKNFPTNE